MNTKEMVLKMLVQEKGRYISGESLSNELKLSRTAVWKHIGSLRGEGYKINAAPRRGYQLESSQDIYNRCAVISRLETKVMGSDLYFYQKVDSTNDELKRLAVQGAREGTVVLAENQLAGRGRRGRHWSSKPGLGIYLSILLKPDIAPGLIQVITLAASSAVCSAIESCTGLKPGIKWPNDILLGSQKVCGILTEMTAEPEKIHSVIVGIGVNVNHMEIDFPDEIRKTTTSLKLKTNGEISRSQLTAGILGEMETVYLDFLNKQSTARFLNIWRSYSVTIGRHITLYQGNKIQKAKALDVLDNGCLLVELPDGERRTIASGEISIR